MTASLVLKSTAALIVALVLQLELFSEIRVFGVMPEIMLGLAVAAGWQGGPVRGAVVGFVGGAMYDVFLPTPLALSALTYAVVGYAVGVVSEPIAEGAERLVRRLFGLGAVAVGMVLFVIVGELLGEPNLYTSDFRKILVIASLYTAVLMPMLHRVANWALREPGPRPVGSFGLLK